METFWKIDESEIAKDMAHLASLINKAEHFDKIVEILGIEDDPGSAWEEISFLKTFSTKMGYNYESVVV